MFKTVRHVAGATLVGLAAIGSLAAVPPALAQEPTEVTLVQGHAKVGVGEDIFLYVVPQVMGWFAEEGLKVNIEGVRGSTLAAQILQSGDAAFATTAPEVIMSVREKGGSITGIMAVRRQGGYQLAVKDGSDIGGIEDLGGATFGAASLASGAVPIVKGMMADLGFAETDYSIVATGTGGQAASALAADQVDVLALWDIMYAAIENRGVPLRTMEIPIIPKLAGFSLATSDAFMDENPDAVRGMCRAVAKGLVFTRENPEAAVRMLYELLPETAPDPMTEAAVQADVNIMTTYLRNATGSDDSVPVGWNYPEKWSFSYQYYQDNGRLTDPEPLETHYTNAFIEDCNAFDAEAIRALARSK
ncbi:ABC transporter substrate-binding protein [Roseospira goensis]|uniref:Thiamine pyrimidine synthase n=1 Tax=Roseospira goensis TaxID=391922 RepID=A0A7W6S0T7_9PROT|nr:ABC transporter substrate-binding protein [Roseospira goensis]MBB4286285.1 NitT/TauT family transport system substrate-binding protein [Roseospira goensis]